ncbi:uncharacterized protein [Ptychodera flava]|uniref:uncharacterized protein n=1 Tax=Ptychodera flava TaxID=63121 RepID=UPI00396A5A38
MARKPSWDDRKKKYDARGCMLTSVPDELWTKYKDAKIVDLSMNKITSIPSQIKELTVIEELSLKDNNLQIFPDAVCQMKSLKILNLESNSFTSVSYNVIQLNQLQEVNLLKSGTPTFPRMICRIPSLKRLHFGFKDLPFRVTSLPDDVLTTLPLEELYLYNCNFSLFPKVIFKIKTLKVLSLVWCKISDELNNLGELSNLKQLTLSCNELTSLPESIGNLSKLEVLHANKNKLASLPAVMKKLSKLKTIDLDDNPFSKGKSMACENKSSKVKSIISQAPVATGGMKPPVESQPKQSVPKQSVLHVTQDTGTKRLSTPTYQSPLKSSVSTQQSRKQPGKEEAKPIATPTYGSSLTSLLQSKQSNTQPGKAETKITGIPTGKSIASMSTGSGTTPEKRISSAPSNTRSLLSTPRETLSQQVSRGVVPTQSKIPTSSVLEKKETGQSLQKLLNDRERKQEELRQKQKIQQQQTQQQRQQSIESKVPARAKTAAVSLGPSPGIGKYSMERKPRGQAVIINNYKFGPFERREGTQFDKENLQSLLKKLHFCVHIYNDLGASDMECVVKTFSLEDHSDFDCFVCFVLSHGSEGKVSGVDGKSVEIRDLTKHFSAENCKTLASKPKLFFIQACQGQMSMGGWMPTDAVFGSTLIPNEADFVIGYSTVPGHVSYRNTEQGSYYIKTLVNQLQQLSDEHDLVSILANVREEVSRTVGVSGGGNCTQVPTVVSTLGKQVYLKS